MYRRGEVVAGDKVVATRTLRLETPGTFEVVVERPSFSKYVLFRNRTKSVGGSQLYFTDDERFNGPVHINGQPGLASWRGGLPQFFDQFTTAATSARYSGDIGPSDHPHIFSGLVEFEVEEVALPTNSNAQLRASLGVIRRTTAASLRAS